MPKTMGLDEACGPTRDGVRVSIASHSFKHPPPRTPARRQRKSSVRPRIFPNTRPAVSRASTSDQAPMRRIGGAPVRSIPPSTERPGEHRQGTDRLVRSRLQNRLRSSTAAERPRRGATRRAPDEIVEFASLT